MTRWANCAVCSGRVFEAAFYNRKGVARPILLEASDDGRYSIERIIAGTAIIGKVNATQRFSKHTCKTA